MISSTPIQQAPPHVTKAAGVSTAAGSKRPAGLLRLTAGHAQDVHLRFDDALTKFVLAEEEGEVHGRFAHRPVDALERLSDAELDDETLQPLDHAICCVYVVAL